MFTTLVRHPIQTEMLFDFKGFFFSIEKGNGYTCILLSSKCDCFKVVVFHNDGTVMING